MALARANGNPRYGRPTILGVQLLGAADDLVAPDDSVDFACDVGGARAAPFVLIELPFATHDNAHLMEEPDPGQRQLIECGIDRGNLSEVCKQSGLSRQARWILLGRALSQPKCKLSDIEIDPQYMTDKPALRPDNEATHVVFVIHGIRDHGFWTQKIARVIKKEAEKDNAEKGARHSFRSFTGSYGYFAMVPFVLPWIRRWKSEWLMDRYVEVCARYPKADISFVGHSNGTYLLARALADYPAAYFKRVVLAGSVIRRDFDWDKWLTRESASRPPRVSEVLNYVATRDWVVAIFSKAFQPLDFFDLGSAGHDGFDQYEPGGRLRLSESHYIEGSHSAALTETQWDDIARFIVRGGSLWLVLGFGVALINSVHGEGILRLGGWPVSQWPGFECGAGEPHSDLCETLAPVRRLLLSAVNWLWAALQGQISTPFYTRPEGWSTARAIVCGAYWWCVYIFTTRF